MLNVDRIYCMDCLEGLKQLDDRSIDCVVTSPPYWGLRDYGIEGQLGLEKTPEEYVNKLVAIFKEVHRVLKWKGTVWLNLGDSYASSGNNSERFDKKNYGGLGEKQVDTRILGRGRISNHPTIKSKDIIGIPWRVAFALQQDGWWLRQDIIWAKPNPMPESVTDRCTKSHEYIFLLTKSKDYYYDADSIKETSVYGGYKDARAFNGKNKDIVQDPKWDKKGENYRNKHSVWNITTKPFKDAHFATFPEDLIEPMVKAGCPHEGIVMDPFMGSGTTGLVARKLLRHYIGFDLNPKYVAMANKRLYNIPIRLEKFQT